MFSKSFALLPRVQSFADSSSMKKKAPKGAKNRAARGHYPSFIATGPQSKHLNMANSISAASTYDAMYVLDGM
jgi:hypothetical protein